MANTLLFGLPFYIILTNVLLAGATSSQSPQPVQPHEVVAKLPANGISIAKLFKLFPGRAGDGCPTSKKEFIRMVKENAAYGPDKLLRPLPPK